MEVKAFYFFSRKINRHLTHKNLFNEMSEAVDELFSQVAPSKLKLRAMEPPLPDGQPSAVGLMTGSLTVAGAPGVIFFWRKRKLVLPLRGQSKRGLTRGRTIEMRKPAPSLP